MNEPRNITRRQFIGEASCKAVGATALFSTLFNLKFANTLAAQSAPNDYRALVCLFLAGGNDSYNMLVPSGPDEYLQYQSIRADLALPQADLLALNGALPDGRTLGVHPGMPEVQALYNSGELAFVSNVGTLVEPTTLETYRSGAADLPLGLFSHSDQIAHWQTSVPDTRSTTGWAGRMADMLQASNAQQNVSMNISLSGNNLFQTGNQVTTFAVPRTNNGVWGIEGYGESGAYEQLITNAIDDMLDHTYLNLFEESYKDIVQNSIDANQEIQAALGAVPEPVTVFSDNNVSASFRMVANIIAARNELGMSRQTFFILFGGWDHHDEVLDNQGGMLPVVSSALNEFHDEMVLQGLNDQVTTFTSSDFGRTLTSNGRGSDHAWGGNHMVMGGAVNGNWTYGSYPELYANNPLDTGRGRLIPTTSVDEYFAELAMWFGVPVSQLDQVLPNINRFYTPDANNKPIGFMS